MPKTKTKSRRTWVATLPDGTRATTKDPRTLRHAVAQGPVQGQAWAEHCRAQMTACTQEIKAILAALERARYSIELIPYAQEDDPGLTHQVFLEGVSEAVAVDRRGMGEGGVIPGQSLLRRQLRERVGRLGVEHMRYTLLADSGPDQPWEVVGWYARRTSAERGVEEVAPPGYHNVIVDVHAS